MSIFYLQQLQEHVGWYAINALVPAFLPFLVIAAVATATDGWAIFIRMLKKSVEAGQLFWVTLGMLASTGYDAFTGYVTNPEQQEFASWAIGFSMVGAFFIAIFIGINTYRAAQGQRSRKKVILLSVAAMPVVFYFYPLVHFRLGRC
jgi:hypothetical protein